MANYEIVENLLEKMLSLLAEIFTESQMSTLYDFFDVGEYGLAYDTAIAMFVEEKKLATPEVLLVVYELSIAMRRDPSIAMSKLRLK